MTISIVEMEIPTAERVMVTDDTLSVVVYEEGDQSLGYLVYVTGPGGYPGPGPGQRLQVRDLCWLNPAAYRACW